MIVDISWENQVISSNIFIQSFQIAAEVAAPLAKTDEIVLLGGADRTTSEINKLVSQLPPAVAALTGVDLSGVSSVDSQLISSLPYILAYKAHHVVLKIKLHIFILLHYRHLEKFPEQQWRPNYSDRSITLHAKDLRKSLYIYWCSFYLF